VQDNNLHGKEQPATTGAQSSHSIQNMERYSADEWLIPTHPHERWHQSRALGMIEKLPAGVFLDVGCATSPLGRHLNEAGWECHGIELSEPIVSAWSLGEVDTTLSLMIALAAYSSIRIWCNVVGTLLRALGRVHFLGLAALIEAVLHIGFGIILLQRMGVIGLAIGSIFSIALTRCWILPLEYYFAFRRQPWGEARDS